MAVKTRPAAPSLPGTTSQLDSNAQAGKAIKVRGGLDTKRGSPRTKFNDQDISQQRPTPAQKRDVQGRTSSQPTGGHPRRGQQGSRPAEDLTIRARPSQSPNRPPSKVKAGPRSKTGTLPDTVPTRKRPDGYSQAHSQAALVTLARQTGVTKHPSLLARGVLADLTEAFTDSMDPRRRKTLLANSERREQGITLQFSHEIFIRFPLGIPSTYPSTSINANFVSIYNERVDSIYPRMEVMVEETRSIPGKWALHNYQCQDDQLLREEFLDFHIDSPQFDLMSGLWSKALGAVMEQLATFFQLRGCYEPGDISLKHQDFNLQAFQRLVAATFHFGDAIIALTSAGAYAADERGDWDHLPALINIPRPQIFEVIHATATVSDLVDLTSRHCSGQILDLMCTEEVPHSLTLSPWSCWTNAASGTRRIKWTAAFITAATKISMANYLRFPPTLDGLKLFVFTGICGGAGVTPSPGMAQWWPDIATLWD